MKNEVLLDSYNSMRAVTIKCKLTLPGLSYSFAIRNSNAWSSAYVWNYISSSSHAFYQQVKHSRAGNTNMHVFSLSTQECHTCIGFINIETLVHNSVLTQVQWLLHPWFRHTCGWRACKCFVKFQRVKFVYVKKLV